VFFICIGISLHYAQLLYPHGKTVYIPAPHHHRKQQKPVEADILADLTACKDLQMFSIG